MYVNGEQVANLLVVLPVKLRRPIATPHKISLCLSGISSPAIRRETTSKVERQKQLHDNRHPMHGHQEIATRLQSRLSFTTVTELGTRTPASYRNTRWKDSIEALPTSVPEPAEQLPPGSDLSRKHWVALNRARSTVTKTADNMVRWGFTDSTRCECGEAIQSLDHLLRHCPAGPRCSEQDLRDATDTAIRWVERWSDKI